MNAKSFVFDVALPGIFVLGAGVATFMLSGGPEEYPSSEDEKEDQEELLVGESNDPDSELNTQNNENLIPKWAIELTEQTKSLSEEVRLLKEAAQANMKLHQEQFHALFLQRNEENKQSSLIEEQVTQSVVQASQRPWTEDDWKIQLRWNVWRLGSTDIDKLKEGEDAFTELRAVVSDENERLKSADTSEEKDSQLDTACDMLIMYMNNVLKNPSIPRYRRIATTNSMHANGLAKVLGHDALLHAVGFISQSDSKHYIYEWHSLPSAEACSSADKEAAPKEGPRKPDSAELARGLLTEAVTLLTALKKGRSALAELILELMDASAVSPTKGRVEEAVVVSPHQQEALSHSTASMQPAVLAPPTSTPMGDESLVTVVDIPDDEGIDLGAASTAASLDFMQILKKAQQQASGARALKPS